MPARSWDDVVRPRLGVPAAGGRTGLQRVAGERDRSPSHRPGVARLATPSRVRLEAGRLVRLAGAKQGPRAEVAAERRAAGLETPGGLPRLPEREFGRPALDQRHASKFGVARGRGQVEQADRLAVFAQSTRREPADVAGLGR